ncbi:MAG: ferritin-like domain-containing protein [Clostridia bacterium]|nr:ferritin-like domain-containing protein [Clostridia bacterium]
MSPTAIRPVRVQPPARESGVAAFRRSLERAFLDALRAAEFYAAVASRASERWFQRTAAAVAADQLHHARALGALIGRTVQDRDAAAAATATERPAPVPDPEGFRRDVRRALEWELDAVSRYARLIAETPDPEVVAVLEDLLTDAFGHVRVWRALLLAAAGVVSTETAHRRPEPSDSLLQRGSASRPVAAARPPTEPADTGAGPLRPAGQAQEAHRAGDRHRDQPIPSRPVRVETPSREAGRSPVFGGLPGVEAAPGVGRAPGIGATPALGALPPGLAGVDPRAWRPVGRRSPVPGPGRSRRLVLNRPLYPEPGEG